MRSERAFDKRVPPEVQSRIEGGKKEGLGQKIVSVHGSFTHRETKTLGRFCGSFSTEAFEQSTPVQPRAQVPTGRNWVHAVNTFIGQALHSLSFFSLNIFANAVGLCVHAQTKSFGSKLVLVCGSFPSRYSSKAEILSDVFRS